MKILLYLITSFTFVNFYECNIMGQKNYSHVNITSPFSLLIQKMKGCFRIPITSNATTGAMEIEQKLRERASLIVVILFISVTIGMFICCRYFPEYLMKVLER